MGYGCIRFGGYGKEVQLKKFIKMCVLSVVIYILVTILTAFVLNKGFSDDKSCCLALGIIWPISWFLIASFSMAYFTCMGVDLIVKMWEKLENKK